MPLVKTIEEGNTRTEVHDLMGGVGNMSADEVLAKTGAKAGTFTEVQPDGSKITYFVEEVFLPNNYYIYLYALIKMKSTKLLTKFLNFINKGRRIRL